MVISEVMMNSNKFNNNQPSPLTPKRPNIEEPIKTFFDAQLAYAKSKHSKAEKRKKANYKKAWYAKRGGSK